MARKTAGTFRPIGDIIRRQVPALRPPTATELRLVESAVNIKTNPPTKDDIAYHHTVFCQTALPYRSVPDRIIERSNGDISLSIEAGRALHPKTNKWVDLPLPFGAQSRLIMIHLDTFAVEEQTPMVDIDNSMTAFLKRLKGYSPNGKELAAFRNHAAAVTGSLFRIASTTANRTFQIDTKIVTSFELWFPRDPDQRQFWPTYMRLSDEYYNTLLKHAVPLDHRAVAALQHNALALDIYKWLAQRLCRIDALQPAFVPWPNVELQFGHTYSRIRDFRYDFLNTLKMVHAHYPRAILHADEKGLLLHRSPPPIAKKIYAVSALLK
jgi:hypothetical protein